MEISSGEYYLLIGITTILSGYLGYFIGTILKNKNEPKHNEEPSEIAI